MKAIWIRPEDIGASSEYSEDWRRFLVKLGIKEIQNAVLITVIEES